VPGEFGRLARLRRYDLLDTAPESPFDRIAGLVRSVLDVPMAAVSLVDEHRQWFRSHDGFDNTETTHQIAFCSHAITARGPIVVRDARLDPRFCASPLVVEPPNIVSYIGAPLISREGHQLGSLCALDCVPRDYSAAQLDILVEFSALVVDTFELRQIATRDFLTGALSRRAFLDAAGQAIARCGGNGQPCTLLLFDLDHFKAVNDGYGHAAGDMVLEAIAACCQALLRGSDVLGRIGGEEFAILLPGVDSTASAAIAERFRAAIESVKVAFNPSMRVTASFGVAPLNERITTPRDWVAAADVALFAAKRGGRNRCREVARNYGAA
jgi:diguanylate cyclase (GGDEF)-like protein